MERRWIYLLTTLLTVVITLSSCSDEQEETRHKVSIALMPLGHPNVEIETRALPTGYLPYVDVFPPEQMPQSSIGVYLVQEPSNAASPINVNLIHSDLNSFVYKVFNNRGAWYSDATIEEGATYRVYGFHPASGYADNSSLAYTHTTTPESEDAVLTLPTFNSVSASDICVVVGVKKADIVNNTPVDIQSSGLELGSFLYTAGVDDNYLYLLMDHIFSCVNFSFTVDATYDALRDIRLRKVEIESTSTANVQVVVTLKSNSTGVDPIQNIQYNIVGTSSTSTVAEIYNKDVANSAILSSSTAVAIPGYFMPPTDMLTTNSNYVLITTYDVLDNAGQVIREGCVAQNKITLPNNLARGTVFTVNAVVKPTYLYQLSDNDLNNPTITTN